MLTPNNIAAVLGAAVLHVVDCAYGQPSSIPRSDVSGADGPVHAIVIANGTVYVGGEFTHFNQQPRTNVAALDVATGLTKEWNPGASGPVKLLAYGNGKIYAAGDFSQIGGQARPGFAELRADSGEVTDWTPALAGRSPTNPPAISAFATTSERLIIGGNFVSAGGQKRTNTAAFDLADGRLLDWSLPLTAGVSALAANEDRVYVGTFDGRISGATPALVFCVKTTNAVDRFQLELGKYAPGPFAAAAPIYSNPNFINGLALSADTLFVLTYTWNGRAPPQIGFNHLIAVRLSDHYQRWATNLLSTFNNPVANCVAADGGAVYVGGSELIQSFPFPFADLNLSSYSAETGQRLAWNPQMDYRMTAANIRAIAAMDSSVFVGGVFQQTNNFNVQNFAAFPPMERPILSLKRIEDGSLEVSLRGEITANAVLQSSKDLAVWSTLSTLAATSRAVVIKPGQVSAADRSFYRVKQ